MIKIIFLVFLAEIFTAAGQILFKKSTNAVKPHDLRKMGARINFLSDVLSKPSIWLGFILMAISLVIWLVALAKGDLSLVFPLGSMQYIMILFLAHAFLEEKIDRMKFIGTFLVVFGIVLITLS